MGQLLAELMWREECQQAAEQVVGTGLTSEM